MRYSQVAPLEMFNEKNTRTNLPAQIDLFAVKGNEYKKYFFPTEKLYEQNSGGDSRWGPEIYLPYQNLPYVFCWV